MVEIVNQVENGQKATAQLSRKPPLTQPDSRWRKEIEARGDAAFTDQTRPDQSLAQRIAELERFCGQLSLENTIRKILVDVPLIRRQEMIEDARSAHPEV